MRHSSGSFDLSTDSFPEVTERRSTYQEPGDSVVKRYRELRPEQKIKCLFSSEDILKAENELFPPSTPSTSSTPSTPSDEPNPNLNYQLFNPVLQRILKCLQLNFLPQFYRERRADLLDISLGSIKGALPRREEQNVFARVVKY